MNPLAICHEMFGDLNFDDICSIVHNFGYDGIEIAPFKFESDIRCLSQKLRSNIRNTAEKYDLQIIACHWLLVSPSGLHITNPNQKILNNTKDFFVGLMDFAHELGIKYLVFGSPQQRSIDQKWDWDSAYRQGVSFFQEMGDVAKRNDLTIAFEPLGASITNFGATTQDGLELIQQIHHSNVKLHLDIAAMARDPMNLQVQLDLVQAQGIDQLAYVHLNDPNQLGPGMGDLDLLPIFQKFKEIDYGGWYSVETFNPDYSAKIIAQQSIENVKKMFSQL